jgi:hypothetical protein
MHLSVVVFDRGVVHIPVGVDDHSGIPAKRCSQAVAGPRKQGERAKIPKAQRCVVLPRRREVLRFDSRPNIGDFREVGELTSFLDIIDLCATWCATWWARG